ncbi:MAG: ThiJ/PfpI family protein [uncultured Quadrisphaera sp.]|uniref:ThiJ/PfpI family protein n=1 Tax=uncultured Quadrisphaera sp. TaxID=904978 RepID=A0A6J4QJC6_9ACTN|nr:MAG: ThiJ/PfpI family protein [uncultured Quadrisphaera sp.]
MNPGEVAPRVHGELAGPVTDTAAGLLRNRPAPPHCRAVDELRAQELTADVREDARWVDDGDLITSADASAGIDLALHLVARLAGPDRARQVRRGLQHDPQPPT